jgi:hypothetical protein
MRTDDPLSAPISSQGIGSRVSGWLLHEMREMVAPTIFFFIGFSLIIFTTNLLVAEYSVSVGTFMLAAVSALLVAKSVLIANAVPLLRRYDDRAPLIQPILFRMVVYSAILALVRLIEHLVEFLLSDQPVRDFVPHMLSTFSWHRFVAVQIWISVLFLTYVMGAELNGLLGDGEIRRLLFSRKRSEMQLERQRRS